MQGIRGEDIIVWAFSTENFKRPKEERDALFNIYRKMARDKEILARLHKNRTRVRIVGDRSMLPRDLASALHKIEIETGAYKNRAINMLIAYGGRADLLHAAKKMVDAAVRKGSNEVNETLFRSLSPVARRARHRPRDKDFGRGAPVWINAVAGGLLRTALQQEAVAGVHQARP